MKQFLAAILGTILAAGGFVIHGLGLGPIIEFLASTSGMWSTLALFGGRFVLPSIGYGSLGTQIVLGAGIMILLITGGRLLHRAREWLKN